MKTKVLIVNDMLNMAGIESFVINLVRNIDRNKYHLDFIRSIKQKGPFDKELFSYGCKIYYIPDVSKNYSLIQHISRFNKVLEKTKPDVVHFHCCVSYAAYDAIIAKKARIRNVIIHSHSASAIGSRRIILHKLMIPIINRVATHRVACSDKAGRWMFANKTFDVIFNGIDLNKFSYNPVIRNEIRNELGVKDEFLLGAVGRLTEVKNHQFLLTLLKALLSKGVNCKLLVIGEGVLKDDLLKLAKELRIEKNFILLNGTTDIHKYYNAMDAYLMPSLYEGLPISGVEAQANSLPCLFSSNISSEVLLTSTAKQLSIDSVDLWIEKIIELNNQTLNRDADLKNLKKAGYAVDTMINNMCTLYQNQ